MTDGHEDHRVALQALRERLLRQGEQMDELREQMDQVRDHLRDELATERHRTEWFEAELNKVKQSRSHRLVVRLSGWVQRLPGPVSDRLIHPALDEDPTAEAPDLESRSTPGGDPT